MSVTAHFVSKRALFSLLISKIKYSQSSRELLMRELCAKDSSLTAADPLFFDEQRTAWLRRGFAVFITLTNHLHDRKALAWVYRADPQNRI